MYHIHSGLQECEELYFNVGFGKTLRCSRERGHEGDHGYQDNTPY